MPAKWFKCPDTQITEITQCLLKCQMESRCATKPFLRLIGYDRKWQGVSPSAAGTGPRQLYLKATTSYSVDPNNRAFAAFGTGTHGELAKQQYTEDVLSEEKLSDKVMQGIADLLEEDENKPGFYILNDYKTAGSFKLAKYLGIVSESHEETVIGEGGKPVILKSGPNKGQPKTAKKTVITQDPLRVDLRAETLQINRYRIFYERAGFPISQMQIQAIPRDGGTYIAKNRGIDRNIYIIPIKRLINWDVLKFYKDLVNEVQQGFSTGFVRKCNDWENWDRKRCTDFCEVADACKEMSHKAGEKWEIRFSFNDSFSSKNQTGGCISSQ